jgi:hypothetical protein
MSTELDPWDADQPEQVRPNRPPGITRVAGVMWMAVGVVYVLFGCTNAVLTDVVQTKRTGIGPSGGTEGCALWLALAIGLGLFLAGKSVAAGKAKDVRTAAILSILLGLFYLISGIAYAVFAERDEALAFVVGGTTTLAIAIGCILPALLALIGRSSYREWRLERLADRSYRRRQAEAAEEEDAEEARPQGAHPGAPEDGAEEGAGEGDGAGDVEFEEAKAEGAAVEDEIEDAVVEEVPEGERRRPARGANERNGDRDAERDRRAERDRGPADPPSAARPER